jgi:hypothetical protein
MIDKLGWTTIILVFLLVVFSIAPAIARAAKVTCYPNNEVTKVYEGKVQYFSCSGNYYCIETSSGGVRVPVNQCYVEGEVE